MYIRRKKKYEKYFKNSCTYDNKEFSTYNIYSFTRKTEYNQIVEIKKGESIQNL